MYAMSPHPPPGSSLNLMPEALLAMVPPPQLSVKLAVRETWKGPLGTAVPIPTLDAKLGAYRLAESIDSASAASLSAITPSSPIVSGVASPRPLANGEHVMVSPRPV